MRTLLSITLCLLSLAKAGDNEPAAAYEPTKFFNTQILPILENRCFECHSHEQKMKGGLTLEAAGAQDMITGDPPASVPEPGVPALVAAAATAALWTARRRRVLAVPAAR